MSFILPIIIDFKLYITPLEQTMSVPVNLLGLA